MIQHNGSICYSPYPPLDYTGVAGSGNRLGLVKYYADDPQLWNLLWLIEPRLDEYLNPSITLDGYTALANTLDHQKFGFAQRALNHDEDLTAFGKPTLRELLTLPPREFMRKLMISNYREVALFEDYGQTIVDTMWGRARISEPGAPNAFKLIQGNFGKG